jgi:arsenate reductase-like glutaredoxin family protein
MKDISNLVQAIKEMNEHIENLHNKEWTPYESLNAARQDRSKLIDVLAKLLTVLKLDITSQAMYNKDYE